PTDAAVRGDDQLELPLDGVAEGDAVLLVPEGDGVEEGRGVGGLELQRPGPAAVGRLVDAGGLAGAGAEQVGSGPPERLDGAEAGLCRAGPGPARPGLAAVGGPRVGARRAARPRDVRAHDAEAAEIGPGVDGLWLPLAQGGRAAEAEEGRGENGAFHGDPSS